ncbi:amino acid permease [Actinomadura madurae]|uniref:amino acid permease n=1 Tax=Actinomadura madurae TaxID=1993 RepID=UPI002027157A|nr:amino acid permease [Actinomadura madurae]URN00215.1 amino acid permease [Actinomadura madurae]
MTLDMRMRNNMFRRLPVEQATGRLYGGRHRLRVVYRTRDLVVLGLGVMIGSGIFKIAGEQASSTAGPGVLVSFLIAGGVCVLAALAFAELSSIVPVAGSAYSFSYVAFGEVWAWVVGWALIMELLLAASVLARVWSLYAAQALQDFGVGVPSWLGELIGQQKGPDLFALGILLLVVLMLATGSRMSLKSLWFMVMAKVIVIGLVIATALKFFSPGNLTPFLPPSQPAPEADQTVLDAVLGALGGGTPHVFGVWGMFAAAPAIAFAYIGFDLIATASEETDDAPRKVPRGILTALVTTIVLYAAVAVALVGMVGMDGIANLNPDKLLLAAAFDSVGAGAMGKIVDVGAMLALTTVILVLMISLTRVVFSISRDGLLPRPLAAMSRYKVPSRATLLAGGAAVVMSQTIDVLTLEQLVVIGSLFAFLFVAAAVLALRRSRPDLHRPFRMPAAPLVVIVTIFAIGWLMLNLNVETWAYFAIWMIVGIGIYLVYGRRKSQMKLLLDAPPPARPVAAPMAPAPPPGAALPPGAAPPPPGAVPGPWDVRPTPGQVGQGTWPGEGRPGTPESPYPTGRYSAGRRPGGRFAPEPYPTDPAPQGGPPGRGPSGAYPAGPPEDPYAVDPGVPNPYPSGPHESRPYGPQPSGPYESGPYESGPSESGPYEPRPYEPGPYEQGGQEQNPRRPGPYGPGYGPGDEPQEPPQGGRHRR